MKPKLKVTLILLLLFASILALNTTVTPILADNTEAISACPAEPTCPPEPTCPDETACETCTKLSVMLLDVQLMLMGEPVGGTGPFRWEGSLTFPDGTEFLQTNYVDTNAYFVGSEVDWGDGDIRGELEIFREEMEVKDACDNVVATGSEKGIFNINTFEYNVKGDLTVCGDAGPLTGKQIKKFFGTGEVWIDDCGAYHAEDCTVYLVCDAESTCPQEPDCPTKCPEEPTCPSKCPDEPKCPKECPDESTCPEEPECPQESELNITYFEGYGYFDVTACPNSDDRDATLLQKCEYNLTKGGRVQFRHHWEPFGEGVNVNTLNSVNLADGTRYMWGNNVIEFCGVTLAGYTTVIMWPDGSLSFQYVNYGDDMLVLWGPTMDGLNVTGLIIEGRGIEDYACAWPEENWQCSSTATPFTGWAEGAAPPEFGPVVGTMDDIELVEGTKIHYYHTWDSSNWVNTTFGLGRIVNTFDSVNNMTDGSSIMWGTHELTFDCITLTGTVTAHRWMDDTGNWVTTGSWVSAGDGYLVIWHYDSRLARQDYGVIIEL